MSCIDVTHFSYVIFYAWYKICMLQSKHMYAQAENHSKKIRMGMVYYNLCWFFFFFLCTILYIV